jgi:L-sorbose 1-phosphate reductase
MPIPQTQHAVQLIGPSQLKLNPEKEVFKPGPHQILAKIECVGLCFSDLKLLKQFGSHVRKGDVVKGLDAAVLKEIPSYVPNEKPTVPGHEATCRIVAVGDQVKHHKVGERCLIQTDYRDLRTASSNAAFGYNFEGALQEYVLMDERVVIDQSGERFLIPVPEDFSASAIALVEPWACVEDSYVTTERQNIKPGGKLLVVAEPGHQATGIDELTQKDKPAAITKAEPSQVAALPNEAFDDILYFGASKPTIDVLNDKLAARGIINIVMGGKKIGQPVSLGVGRIHYGMTRWIGTTGNDPAESYKIIPANGELRPGDSVCVVGAGGPMGQMHIIRSICSGIEGVKVIGTDMDDARIESLAKKARPLANVNGVELRLVNTAKNPLREKFTYIALMAPIGALVANAVRDSAPGCLINIFAGIPAPTKHDIDLDTCIASRCFIFGTSGSTLSDMKIVLKKVTARQLDTNCSVDAISGMAGAVDGIAAVENRTLAGKILVYPMLHDVGLIPLSELRKAFPTVAAKLDNGNWTTEAEQELLRVAGK